MMRALVTFTTSLLCVRVDSLTCRDWTQAQLDLCGVKASLPGTGCSIVAQRKAASCEAHRSTHEFQKGGLDALGESDFGGASLTCWNNASSGAELENPVLLSANTFTTSPFGFIQPQAYAEGTALGVRMEIINSATWKDENGPPDKEGHQTSTGKAELKMKIGGKIPFKPSKIVLDYESTNDSKYSHFICQSGSSDKWTGSTDVDLKIGVQYLSPNGTWNWVAEKWWTDSVSEAGGPIFTCQSGGYPCTFTISPTFTAVKLKFTMKCVNKKVSSGKLGWDKGFHSYDIGLLREVGPAKPIIAKLAVYTKVGTFGWTGEMGNTTRDSLTNTIVRSSYDNMQGKKSINCTAILQDSQVNAQFEQWQTDTSGSFHQDPSTDQDPIQLQVDLGDGAKNWKAVASKRCLLTLSEGIIQKRMLCITPSDAPQQCCVSKSLTLASTSTTAVANATAKQAAARLRIF